MDKKKHILIAAAWPYANGSLHLGHVASLIGADILARYFRLQGNPVLFVSGSDCHGTPIAVEAERQGIAPQEIAEKYHAEFVATLVRSLGFSYDLFTKTTTENHKLVVQEIFLKLHRDGLIYAKTVEQPYCPTCKRFLPDRYVEGECPQCHFAAARGDQCDECGALLDSKELLKPRCKICGTAPEWRSSEHFFFRLSAFEKRLADWVEKSAGWRPNARRFTEEFLKQGLHDRAITRDLEWGIPVPLPGYEEKRIYVWFEAVCGYLSASKEWASAKGDAKAWESFWLNGEAFHYYVHGKDNIPFHSIIWPAILLGYGYLHLPDRIVSSEFLMLEGKQFSKSRRWAVWLPDFLARFDPETLRYFLVANGPETADADFSWSEYRAKVNGELIGNFGNFIHRTLSLVKTNFPDGARNSSEPDERQKAMLAHAKESFGQTGSAIEEGCFRDGLKAAFRLAEEGNRFLNDTAPWAKIKEDRAEAERDLAVAGHVVRCLSILVAPYLPATAERIAEALGESSASAWRYPAPAPVKVAVLRPLYRQIEPEEVDAERARLGKG